MTPRQYIYLAQKEIPGEWNMFFGKAGTGVRWDLKTEINGLFIIISACDVWYKYGISIL